MLRCSESTLPASHNQLFGVGGGMAMKDCLNPIITHIADQVYHKIDSIN
uniref:Uncharacterized protein n=1 Tax=Arundo donax TaxID=35708 RepID=A0A0A9I9D3_ARUDO